MKRRIAFALASVMALSVPVASYAITDDEAAQIYDDIIEANNGNNGEVFEIEDGEVTDSSGPVYLPEGDDGMPIYDSGVNGGEGGYITSETPQNEIVDPENQAIAPPEQRAKPNVFGVSSSSITNNYFTDGTQSPEITIKPPFDSAKRLKTYAILIADYAGNVHLAKTGITPTTDGGNVVDTVFSAGDLDVDGFKPLNPGTGYRIIIYSLSTDGAIEGITSDSTLAEFEDAISGDVIGQTRLNANTQK